MICKEDKFQTLSRNKSLICLISVLGQEKKAPVAASRQLWQLVVGHSRTVSQKENLYANFTFKLSRKSHQNYQRSYERKKPEASIWRPWMTFRSVSLIFYCHNINNAFLGISLLHKHGLYLFICKCEVYKKFRFGVRLHVVSVADGHTVWLILE